MDLLWSTTCEIWSIFSVSIGVLAKLLHCSPHHYLDLVHSFSNTAHSFRTMKRLLLRKPFCIMNLHAKHRISRFKINKLVQMKYSFVVTHWKAFLQIKRRILIEANTTTYCPWVQFYHFESTTHVFKYIGRHQNFVIDAYIMKSLTLDGIYKSKFLVTTICNRATRAHDSQYLVPDHSLWKCSFCGNRMSSSLLKLSFVRCGDGHWFKHRLSCRISSNPPILSE